MKGHPILGVICGFFFGLFGGATLFMFGVIPLHSPLLWILPLVGIVLGMVMAAWAPFGSGPTPAAATAGGIAYGADAQAGMPPSGGSTLEQETTAEQPSAGDPGAEDDGDHGG